MDTSRHGFGEVDLTSEFAQQLAVAACQFFAADADLVIHPFTQEGKIRRRLEAPLELQRLSLQNHFRGLCGACRDHTEAPGPDLV